MGHERSRNLETLLSPLPRTPPVVTLTIATAQHRAAGRTAQHIHIAKSTFCSTAAAPRVGVKLAASLLDSIMEYLDVAEGRWVLLYMYGVEGLPPVGYS